MMNTKIKYKKEVPDEYKDIKKKIFLKIQFSNLENKFEKKIKGWY